MSIIRLHTDAHHEAQELLPWFVLGTLNAEETALVQEHVRTCSQCQTEVEQQRKLQAVPPAPPHLDFEPDVNRAFARLKPQLAALQQEKNAPRLEDRLENLRQVARQWWMPWVIAAQTAALACLCIVLMQKQPGPVQYVALGAHIDDKSNVVVMFKPQTTEAELRRILQGADARVVDGPTVTGAYLLHVGDAERTNALANLRHDPAVAMAESLGAGGKQ